MTLWKAARVGWAAPTDGGNRRRRREISQVTGQRGRRGLSAACGRRRFERTPCLDDRWPMMRRSRYSANAASCAARRARRAHGPVRRLRHADPVSGRRSSRNICTRARRPGCSTSRTWVRRCSKARTTRVARAFSRRCAPPTSSDSRRAAALHPAPQRERRHRRRPDGHAPAGTPTARLRLVVNAARKAVDFALIRERLPARRASDPARRRGAARAAGAARRGDPGAARSRRGLEAHGLHERAPARIGGVETFVSRSGYTGEDGFEISLPPSQAERFARSLLRAARRRAGRSRRARFAAARGGPLPLWPRHRRDASIRSRPALVWSIQKRRRVEGGFPGVDAHSARR